MEDLQELGSKIRNRCQMEDPGIGPVGIDLYGRQLNFYFTDAYNKCVQCFEITKKLCSILYFF